MGVPRMKSKKGNYLGLLCISLLILVVILMLDLPKQLLFVLIVAVIVNGIVIEIKYNNKFKQN